MSFRRNLSNKYKLNKGLEALNLETRAADNQLVFNVGTKTVTLDVAEPSANRILSINDPSGNAAFVFTKDGILTLSGHLIPDTNNTYNIGNTTNKFNTIYTTNIFNPEIGSNLVLASNGSGGGLVEINDNLTVNGNLATNYIENRTPNANLILFCTGSGYVIIQEPLEVTGTLTVDSITSRTTNGNLTLVGNGSGHVVINDNLLQVGPNRTQVDSNDSLYIEKDGNYSQIQLFNTDTTNPDIRGLLSINRTGVTNGFGSTVCGLNLWTVTSHPVRIGANSTAAQTINTNGRTTFHQAILLPTTGGTASNFDYYEEGSFTLTLSGIIPSTNGIVKFVRCGACVNLRIPTIENTSTSGGSITFSGWPSRISPYTGSIIGFPLRVKDGSIQADMGWIDFTSASGGSINRNMAGAGFGSGITVGLTAQISFCTTVP